MALDPLMTVKEVADYFSVERHTVYGWRYRGIGPRGFRLGKTGGLRFRRSDVEAWMEENEDMVLAARSDS